jgi:cytochrome c biogenesis protein
VSDNSSSSSFGERVWNFFASVKLSFALLLILAVTSVAGTLLVQKEPAELYLRQFGQTWGGLILGLQLDNMYSSVWFRFFMTLLAVNLVICSLNRLPGVLKIIRKDPATDLEKKRKAAHSFTLTGGPDEAAGGARQALAKEVGQVHEKLIQEEKGEGLVMLAQKGAWSRLGVYVVHASVLIIFAGAMIGNIYGFGGDMTLHEGETLDHIEVGQHKIRKLGFSLRLDKFTISQYPNGMISEFRSDVTFLQDGKEVQKNSMVVNDPAEFNGIDFYQASYGSSPGNVKVRIFQDGKTFDVLMAKPKTWYPLPDGGQAGVLQVRDNVNMGQMYNGPVARVFYKPANGEAVAITAFKEGNKMPQRGPVKIDLIEFKIIPYSGIQVKYDPGVWFIWVGCTLMVIGFIVAFYFAHRKVWIRLEPADKNRTRVEIAGSTNKNKIGLERIMQRLAGELRGGE